jgi:hypothetical protein
MTIAMHVPTMKMDIDFMVVNPLESVPSLSPSLLLSLLVPSVIRLSQSKEQTSSYVSLYPSQYSTNLIV